MALRAGKVLRGATGTYEVLSALKAPTVYKPQVLSDPRISDKWAVVKTAVGELVNDALKREYRNYEIPNIALRPYIRTLYERLCFVVVDEVFDGNRFISSNSFTRLTCRSRRSFSSEVSFSSNTPVVLLSVYPPGKAV